MPLYEFRCEKCQKEFEVQIKLDDISLDEKGKPITACLNCGGFAKIVIKNPAHYKHSSWANWRAERSG